MNGPGRFRVLVVCSGNVCRSPLAELLLGQALSARTGFVVDSAGTIARPGQRMTEEMLSVASRHGIPREVSSAHEAKRLSENLVAGADLVLGLTRAHRSDAVQRCPSALKRTFTLREFARLALATSADGELPETAGELVAKALSRRGRDAAHGLQSDDIDDPIGLPQSVYDRVGQEIAHAVDVVAGVLRLVRAETDVSSVPQDVSHAPRLSLAFRRH